VRDRSEGSVAALLDASAGAVAQIGPWEEPRRGPPPREHVRLSFLTPGGLHFGEGPVEALDRDPLAASILRGATALVAELV